MIMCLCWWGMGIEGEGLVKSVGDGNKSFVGSGRNDQIRLCKKWKVKEMIEAERSGGTAE